MSIRISIDPGVACGVVVWDDGKPCQSCSTTLNFRSDRDKWTRLETIDGVLWPWLQKVFNHHDIGWQQIEEVLVEKPHIWTRKEALNSIFDLCYRAAAIGLFFRHMGVPVKDIQKRPEDHIVGGQRLPAKEAAKEIAGLYGISGSHNVCDAVLLGIIAGYDRA